MNEYAFRQTMLALTQLTVDIALALVGAFIAIAFLWNMLTALIKTGKPAKLGTLISLFISAFILVLYAPILGITLTFTSGVSEMLPPTDIGVLWSNTWTDWMNNVWLFVKGENMNIMQKIIAGNGTYLIRKVIEYLQIIILGLLTVFGPLAILFDVIPIFKGSAIRWYMSITSIGLWSLTFNVLDQFFHGYLNMYSEVNGHNWLTIAAGPFQDQGMLFHTIICIVFMILYCLVPFITTLYIARTDAAALGGKIFSIAALGTAVAVKAGTLGAGFAASAAAKSTVIASKNPKKLFEKL